jgi:hypothetical protein
MPPWLAPGLMESALGGHEPPGCRRACLRGSQSVRLRLRAASRSRWRRGGYARA